MGVEDKDILVQILTKISEVSDRVTRIETKVDVMENDLSQVKKEDAKQNELLAQHILGVRTNSERLELEKQRREVLEARLESVENIPKFFSALKTIFIWVGAVIAPIATVVGLYYSAMKIMGGM